MRIYLDTNIFIYFSDKKSLFYKKSFDLIKYCQNNNVSIITSVETIQEIIHFSKRRKKIKMGVETSRKTLSLVDELLTIDRNTIEIFLRIINKTKTTESRDSLHIASCLQNKIHVLITYDKELKKFKEIRALNPNEFLRSFRF